MNATVPTLILHGDDDQIVPIAGFALLSVKLVENATLKVYKAAPHGMVTTQNYQVNDDDLLAFIKLNSSERSRPRRELKQRRLAYRALGLELKSLGDRVTRCARSTELATRRHS